MELRIKDILREKGLTIKDVAERMGTDSSNLSSALKKGNPKLSMLVDVANAIGCDITELFKPNEEAYNAPRSGSQALVLIDGEAYRLTKAKDVVRLPTYTDYAELRNNLRGFILRAEKNKEKKPFSMMGMVEMFEVFNLLYVPNTSTFHLTLCYKNGKYDTHSYDAQYEYNTPTGEDDSWDTETLYLAIRDDIEGAVKTKIEAEKA